MAPQTFPQYSDGNVEIHFSTSDEKYILHSHVLALHSPWFKASLSQRWNTGNEDRLVDGKNHWVYELRFDKDTDIGMLMRKSNTGPSTTTNTEFILGSKEKLPSTTSQADKELHERRVKSLKAHQQLLGTLYHLPPTFSHSSFDSAKAQILEFAKVADIYGSEHVAKTHIESHLRLYRAEVLDLCADSPADMLELATTVKSEWIFMEAATHLLGRSNRFFESVQPRLEELQVVDLMKRKRAEFVQKLRDCEFEMFKMQPPTPEEHYYAYCAASFFRQWLSEELLIGHGTGLSPSYATLYHTIAKKAFPITIDSNKTQVIAFMSKSYNNFTLDDLQNLSDALEIVFTNAAGLIEPILKDATRRQGKKQGTFRSLICMSVGDDELPWLQK